MASFKRNDENDTGFFMNENGFKLFCKYWSKKVENPRALLFMCHGAGEHCLYYGQMAEMLTEKGFFVFGHDHQGHGQSEGSRVHINDFHDYVRDVFVHCDLVKNSFPRLPIFLLGHSMGGTVSITAANERPDYFTGVVLIAPAVTPDQDSVGAIRIFFGKIIARLFPQLPVLWLDDSNISRDEAVNKKYQEDPLNHHGGLKAKWGLCLLHALQECESKLSSVTWPFLVLHGDKDRIVSYRGSEALYQKASSQDKTLKMYPGCYHQLHYELEPEGSQVRQEIVDWFVARVPDEVKDKQ